MSRLEPSPSDRRGRRELDRRADRVPDSPWIDRLARNSSRSRISAGKAWQSKGTSGCWRPGPLLMDGPGNLAFARARFADDQHGGRRRRGQTHLVEQPPVGWAKADQAIEAMACPLELA